MDIFQLIKKMDKVKNKYHGRTLMYTILPTKAFFYYLPSLMNLVEFWTAKSKIIDVDLLFLMSSRFAEEGRCGNIFDNFSPIIIVFLNDSVPIESFIFDEIRYFSTDFFVFYQSLVV